jgi:type VI secretion system protein ImpF
MAHLDVERNAQQCLLDKLIDYEPDVKVEAQLTRAESLRHLRAAVKRDLEWLLNSIRSVEPVPEGYTELRKSLFYYGLTDITSVTLESVQDEQQLLRSLEAAITMFEPRLTRVHVITYERVTKKKQAIQFYVEALLMVDPAPERISFDTVLEIAKGTYQVRGEQRA